ncbi:hypothetical protein GCM10022381_33240 [Leifsonia kafniensis]|uniref:CsbD family protein n=1 Tax=Leifsonia kafniensis TaxID=475957 RepID=A0ABP7KWJ4_9MICO
MSAWRLGVRSQSGLGVAGATEVDELKADAEVKMAEAGVKKAEAERDATHAKNDLKEDLHGDN